MDNTGCLDDASDKLPTDLSVSSVAKKSLFM